MKILRYYLFTSRQGNKCQQNFNLQQQRCENSKSRILAYLWDQTPYSDPKRIINLSRTRCSGCSFSSPSAPFYVAVTRSIWATECSSCEKSLNLGMSKEWIVGHQSSSCWHKQYEVTPSPTPLPRHSHHLNPRRYPNVKDAATQNQLVSPFHDTSFTFQTWR